jgi:hypothetical protein
LSKEQRLQLIEDIKQGAFIKPEENLAGMQMDRRGKPTILSGGRVSTFGVVTRRSTWTNGLNGISSFTSTPKQEKESWRLKHMARKKEVE